VQFPRTTYRQIEPAGRPGIRRISSPKAAHPQCRTSVQFDTDELPAVVRQRSRAFAALGDSRHRIRADSTELNVGGLVEARIVYARRQRRKNTLFQRRVNLAEGRNPSWLRFRRKFFAQVPRIHLLISNAPTLTSAAVSRGWRRSKSLPQAYPRRASGGTAPVGSAGRRCLLTREERSQHYRPASGEVVQAAGYRFHALFGAYGCIRSRLRRYPPTRRRYLVAHTWLATWADGVRALDAERVRTASRRDGGRCQTRAAGGVTKGFGSAFAVLLMSHGEETPLRAMGCSVQLQVELAPRDASPALFFEAQ